MLFSSYLFLLIFLPVVLAGFYLLKFKALHRAALIWLVAASLFFYGWWNPAYLTLILFSIAFNYLAGSVLSGNRGNKKTVLALGIGANLAVLGYFKYANFFVDSANHAAGYALFELEPILLPLAISFFTFQQIAYLVDAYRGLTREYRLLHYSLFVVFFPQLIAGPIVHHKEIIPQFERLKNRLKPKTENFAVGLTILGIGLFKKVGIADHLAFYADQVFDAAARGAALTFFEAWTGALAYSLQLYFDFSGYSDMAIGLARLFGVRLPLNFYSPYKSASIIDFWRRWHITLSRFLRDYLYIPLGGNRKGPARRYVNLFITMVLGGLWHGAGWTFMLWGALHGGMLVVNHLWRSAVSPFSWHKSAQWRIAATVLTFTAVVFAWVPFRADGFDAAWLIWQGMAGLNGVALPAFYQGLLGGLGTVLKSGGVVFQASFFPSSGFHLGILWILFGLLVCFFLPATHELMSHHRPVWNSPSKTKGLFWKPGLGWAAYVAFLWFVSLLTLERVREFLYFQF